MDGEFHGQDETKFSETRNKSTCAFFKVKAQFGISVELESSDL